MQEYIHVPTALIEELRSKLPAHLQPTAVREAEGGAIYSMLDAEILNARGLLNTEQFDALKAIGTILAPDIDAQVFTLDAGGLLRYVGRAGDLDWPLPADKYFIAVGAVEEVI